MKFYKYYETTEEYEIDAPNIGEYEHYTIYIADTNTSLINSKYPITSYFVYRNNDSKNIKIANNVRLIKQAICLNNMSVIEIPASGELTFTNQFDPGAEIRILIEFKHDITSLNGVFAQCPDLIAVRGNVFASCPRVQDCRNVFYGCTELTELSESMFTNNTQITSAASMCVGCTSLSSIPENIFKYNTGITNVSNVFKGCKGLTSIPENIFKNNTGIMDVSFAFQNCTVLTSIPNNLFANNKSIVDFTNCFSGCTNLDGNTPKGADGIELWDRINNTALGYPNSITGTGCFTDCVGLDEYDLNADNPIPTNWGGDRVKTITAIVYPTKGISSTGDHLDGTSIKLTILNTSDNYDLPEGVKLYIKYTYDSGNSGLQLENTAENDLANDLTPGSSLVLEDKNGNKIKPLRWDDSSNKYYGIRYFSIESMDKRYKLNIVKPNIELRILDGKEVSFAGVINYYYVINSTKLTYSNIEINVNDAFLGITDLTYSFEIGSPISYNYKFTHSYESPSGSGINPNLLPEIFESGHDVDSISGYNTATSTKPSSSPFYYNSDTNTTVISVRFEQILG